jgi:hypothetical protein
MLSFRHQISVSLGIYCGIPGRRVADEKEDGRDCQFSISEIRLSRANIITCRVVLVIVTGSSSDDWLY